MKKNIQSLLQVLNRAMLQKITQETGFFSLGYDGKMRFQSFKEWAAFQRKYGDISPN